ncbi:unnamed protein product [Polarella glacialis]|uniref:Uncharacterized protein n=1 Tax=Polarella glacialis TaxID=89957 RepID=A0A813G0Z6_POLGL|nr:unnamed protein product [Polarella glacialis]
MHQMVDETDGLRNANDAWLRQLAREVSLHQRAVLLDPVLEETIPLDPARRKPRHGVGPHPVRRGVDSAVWDHSAGGSDGGDNLVVLCQNPAEQPHTELFCTRGPQQPPKFDARGRHGTPTAMSQDHSGCFFADALRLPLGKA